ncbi:MAG: hypothetical protein J6J24_00100 [Clostridia bacterium]|nr:hypothetical protein [Clostridia bacterium]
MIKNIVELFYHLSEKHKLVRGFKYGTLSKDMGIGSEAHPFVFLEQPMYFGNTDTTTGTVPVTLNVDFLITPQMLENYGIYPSTESGQNLCYHIGLNFIARIRQMIQNGDLEWISSIASWNWLTLYHFYDNDAEGIRFSLVLNVKNQINFCDTDEHFDENKEFDIKKYLPEIETDDASGCSIFSNKLSKFDL